MAARVIPPRASSAALHTRTGNSRWRGLSAILRCKPSPESATLLWRPFLVLRIRRAATTCRATSSSSFFQTDVVEYGNRYNRPDRFPRLKQANKARRNVDVIDWLGRLCAIGDELRITGLGLPECDEVVECQGAVETSRQLLLLAKQGKLEEALRLVEQWEAQREEHLANKKTGGHVAVLPHTQVLLAAVDAGDVALAFEYAGLLTPNIDAYNLLMAAYSIRHDLDAVTLAMDTAKRRGISLNATTFLLASTAALLVGNVTKACAFLSEAKAQGALKDLDYSALAAAVAAKDL